VFSNANLRSWNERGIGRAQRGTVFQKPTGSTYLWEQEHWLDGRRVILRIVCSIVEILVDVTLFGPERGLHKLELQKKKKESDKWSFILLFIFDYCSLFIFYVFFPYYLLREMCATHCNTCDWPILFFSFFRLSCGVDTSHIDFLQYQTKKPLEVVYKPKNAYPRFVFCKLWIW